MFSKFNEKPDSFSRKKIVIPQIIRKSKSKTKHKNQSKQYSQEVQYGTDSKKHSNYSHSQIDQLKEIISSCSNCKQKLSQFATKKPHRNHQKSTQTSYKPFIIDLIQERIENICRQNTKMTKMLQQKQEQIVERQQQINEIQDKFTNILYSLGQQLCYLKIKNNDQNQLKQNMQCNSQTPAYLKALFFDS